MDFSPPTVVSASMAATCALDRPRSSIIPAPSPANIPTETVQSKVVATDLTTKQTSSPSAISVSKSADTENSEGIEEDEGVVGCGNFRKQGSNVKNWKTRKYFIKRDGVLTYVDPSSGSIKGTITVKIIELYEGKPSNIEESGCTVISDDEPFALDLNSIDGQR